DKFLVLYLLLIFPAFIGIIRYFLQLLQLWQVKEYRIDRVASYLRYEKKYTQIGTILWLMKIAFLVNGVLYILYPNAGYLSFTYILAYVLYFMHLEWFITDIISRRLVRPRVKSLRNLLISSAVLAFIVSIYSRILVWFLQFDFHNVNFVSPEGLTLKNLADTFNPAIIQSEEVIPLLTLVVGLTLCVSLFIDLLIPFWTFLMVMATAPLSYISRKRKIMAAKRIIREKGSGMKIVAITGSYGKTTTKELIYEIIKDKYKVAKTPLNNNTAVGLAQAVKTYIKEDTEVFVVEMGAYRKGEIKQSTKIVSPDIAVVTALSQQHVSLFGSVEKLYQAKFELIDGLKDDGVAIFNGDDEKCQMMSRETSKEKVFFFKKNSEGLKFDKFKMNTDQLSSEDNNLYISNVIDLGDVLDVQIRYKGEIYRFKVGLKEERFTINLAAAILVALQLGMTMDDIITKISSWNYSVEYLKVHKGINESLIIDDGKTSNKEGFLLALDYLNNKFEGNKWVMTQGIIELGNERYYTYKELAENIVEVSNGLISNDDNLITAVRNAKSNFVVTKVNNINGFADAYKFNVKKGDKVLIEGIFPQTVLNQIIVYDS
ncbi:MAG TPA: Mur ligase family protein, partial [Candidatus Woesebacteria bacterium]|nr:Mur ligase family protein [Candidatus Woesebacteria bacterium]